MNWHGSLSIVQSSSLASQFAPYQWKPHWQLYVPASRDASVVESVHTPLFWHGIDAQAAAPTTGPTGGGGGPDAASHVKPFAQSGFGGP